MTRPADARTRLVETADRLFYAHGIRAVGIDRVIAEAGAAKATLYAHFPTKDDLILAVLEHREGYLLSALREAMDRHTAAGADPLDGFFAALADWFRSPGFRGCAFLNAAVELADPDHPASRYVAGYRGRFRRLLGERLRAAAGPAGAGRLPAVAMLVEGAIVSALLDGRPAAARVARDAARRLLDPPG